MRFAIFAGVSVFLLASAVHAESIGNGRQDLPSPLVPPGPPQHGAPETPTAVNVRNFRTHDQDHSVRPSLVVEPRLTLHLRRTEVADFEPRYGLAVHAQTPQSFGNSSVYALTSAGAGYDVFTDSFSGKFKELEFALGLSTAVKVGERLSLAGRVGSSVHMIELEGVTRANGERTVGQRTNAHIDGGVSLRIHLREGVELSINHDVSRPLRRQRFIADDSTVLTLPKWQLGFGLSLLVLLH